MNANKRRCDNKNPRSSAVIVKNITFDTNVLTPTFSDNYNATTEYTEGHRACICFSPLCTL